MFRFPLPSKLLWLIGGMMMFIGMGMIGNTVLFVSNSLTTKGRVVALHWQYVTGSDASRPVIEFVSEKENTIRFSPNISSNPPMYDIGEIVEVIYDPQNPQNANIDQFLILWLSPLTIFLVGVGMVTLGVVIPMWILPLLSS